MIITKHSGGTGSNVLYRNSSGNVNHDIYRARAVSEHQTTLEPVTVFLTQDWGLHLTEKGWQQALCAGQELKQIIAVPT